jgi:hypothetical protein
MATDISSIGILSPSVLEPRRSAAAAAQAADGVVATGDPATNPFPGYRPVGTAEENKPGRRLDPANGLIAQAGTDDEEGPSPDGSPKLSKEEETAVAKLKQRDQEVRAHEQAHVAAGGQYAGAPSYEYTTGPDGRRYAVGGEVSIDTSAVPGDPEATVRKLEQVIAAALAPADPSGQDQAVAAAAQKGKLQAQQEARDKRNEEAGRKEGGTEATDSVGNGRTAANAGAERAEDGLDRSGRPIHSGIARGNEAYRQLGQFANRSQPSLSLAV